jgi:hypothetical protein
MAGGVIVARVARPERVLEKPAEVAFEIQRRRIVGPDNSRIAEIRSAFNFGEMPTARAYVGSVVIRAT